MKGARITPEFGWMMFDDTSAHEVVAGADHRCYWCNALIREGQAMVIGKTEIDDGHAACLKCGPSNRTSGGLVINARLDLVHPHTETTAL